MSKVDMGQESGNDLPDTKNNNNNNNKNRNERICKPAVTSVSLDTDVTAFSIFGHRVHLRAESGFLLLSIIFGLLMLFLTPPFQVPDEIVHFHRAYAISEGNVVMDIQDGAAGAEMPSSVSRVVAVSEGLPFNPAVKQDLLRLREMLSMPLNPEDRIFISVPGAGNYAPVPYLPHILGIWTGRLMNLPVLQLFYLTRLFGFAAWISLTWLAVRLMPWGKWLLTVVALMPMSLYEGIGISADAMTVGLCFLFCALVFRAMKNEPISRNSWITLAGLSLLLPLCKGLYILLLGLLLLIPFRSMDFFGLDSKYMPDRKGYGKSDVGNTRRQPVKKEKQRDREAGALPSCKSFRIELIAVIFIWGAALGVFFLWSAISGHLPSENRIPGANAPVQIVGMLEDPFRTIGILFKSVVSQFTLHFNEMIGVLGWLDTWLPNEVYIGYVFLLCIVFLLDGPRHDVGIRIWSSMIFLLGCIAVFLSLYIVWSPVGSPFVQGVQGRYFIPFLPLAASAAGIQLLPRARKALPLLVPCLVILLAASLFGMGRRYFG